MAGTTQLSTLTPEQKALFKKIDEDILNAIQEDGRSFSDFGKAGMKKVLKHVDEKYSPQDRRTVAKKFKRDYKWFRKLLKKNLKYIKHFALTTDFWKNIPHVHFLGLTIHFFSGKFKYYSALIAFKKFKGRHLNIISTIFYFII